MNNKIEQGALWVEVEYLWGIQLCQVNRELSYFLYHYERITWDESKIINSINHCKVELGLKFHRDSCYQKQIYLT